MPLDPHPRRRVPSLLEPLDPRRLLSTTTLPDLAVNSISLAGDQRATYNPGDTLFPVADASSSGGPSRVAPVAYALSLDDVAGNADDIPLSPPNTGLAWARNPADTTSVPPPLAATFVDIPASIPAGTYHLVATIDPDNAVAESDESNNALLGPTVTIAPAVGTPDQPNLSLSNPHVVGTAAQIFPGSSLTVASYPQSDPTSAVPRADVAYVLSSDTILGNADDIPLGTTSLPTVAPGTTLADATFASIFTLPTSIPAGTYHLIATVDAQHAVAESNETDNTVIAADTVVVDHPIVDPLPASNPPASPGSTLATTLLLINPAKHKALVRQTVKTYFSSDARLSRNDTLFSTRRISAALRPGQAKSLALSLKIPTTAPLGTRYIITVTTTPAGERHITSTPLTPRKHPKPSA